MSCQGIEILVVGQYGMGCYRIDLPNRSILVLQTSWDEPFDDSREMVIKTRDVFQPPSLS